MSLAARDDATLRSGRFRQEREADWHRLDGLLRQIEAASLKHLSDADLLALPVLYRSALSSLSLARAISLDQGLIDYLESLCSRAYFLIYSAHSTLLSRMIGFFRTDWAAAVRDLLPEILVSAAFTLLGVLTALALTLHDPDWYYSIVPAGLAGGRNPAASAGALRAALFGNSSDGGLLVLATFLFTHNAQIAFLAFALGFALCLPTALLMLYQGAVVGAFLALYVRQNLGIELGGWLMIHGVTEILAVTLAGAAGLRIGRALALPGRDTRMHSLARHGRSAATVMAGVVIMLFCAGLLEGFARQLIQSTLARYSIAGWTALFWGVFLFRPHRRPKVAE